MQLSRSLNNVVLFAVLAAMVMTAGGGVVVSFSGSAIDTSEWFPCIGRRCGCRSAEMCRTSCRCPKESAWLAPPAAPAGGCCSRSGEDKSRDPSPATDDDAGWTLILRAAGCAGAPPADAGKFGGWVAPRPQSIEWIHVPCVDLAPIAGVDPHSHRASPEPPPPRAV